MKLAFTMMLLVSSFIVEAAPRRPMIVNGASEIDILFATTKLPYNILLGRDPKCYVGTAQDVEMIVKKMIANHSFGSYISVKKITTDSIDKEMTVTLDFGHSTTEFNLHKCNIQ